MIIIQWILGVLLFFFGIGMMSDGILIAVFMIPLSLLMIPTVFDKINFKFASKSLYRKAFKIGLLIITSLFASSLLVINDENKVKNINSLITEINEYHDIDINSDEEVMSLLYKVESVEEAINVDEGLKNKFNLFLTDAKLIKENIKPSSSGLINSDPLNVSVEDYDLILDHGNLKIVSNTTLNSIMNDVYRRKVLSEDDFSSKEDYLIYRANHAVKYGDVDKGVQFYFDAFKENRKIIVNESLLLEVYDFVKDEAEKFKIIESQIKRDYSSNVVILNRLGDTYYDRELYKSAFNVFNKAYVIEPDNTEVIRKMAMSAYKRKHKKTAIKYFEELNEKGALDNESCKLLRELTRYFSHYTYYSNCCDGTTSSSTGRGSCSHHGGVCSTGKTANYRYKYERCR